MLGRLCLALGLLDTVSRRSSKCLPVCRSLRARNTNDRWFSLHLHPAPHSTEQYLCTAGGVGIYCCVHSSVTWFISTSVHIFCSRTFLLHQIGREWSPDRTNAPRRTMRARWWRLKCPSAAQTISDHWQRKPASRESLAVMVTAERGPLEFWSPCVAFGGHAQSF